MSRMRFIIILFDLMSQCYGVTWTISDLVFTLKSQVWLMKGVYSFLSFTVPSLYSVLILCVWHTLVIYVPCEIYVVLLTKCNHVTGSCELSLIWSLCQSPNEWSGLYPKASIRQKVFVLFGIDRVIFFSCWIWSVNSTRKLCKLW